MVTGIPLLSLHGPLPPSARALLPAGYSASTSTIHIQPVFSYRNRIAVLVPKFSTAPFSLVTLKIKIVNYWQFAKWSAGSMFLERFDNTINIIVWLKSVFSQGWVCWTCYDSSAGSKCSPVPACLSPPPPERHVLTNHRSSAQGAAGCPGCLLLPSIPP